MNEYAVLTEDFVIPEHWEPMTVTENGHEVEIQFKIKEQRWTKGLRVEIVRRGTAAAGFRSVKTGTPAAICFYHKHESTETEIGEVDLLVIPMAQLKVEQ